MKKVIKIKESDILGVINKLIKEETAGGEIKVSATSQIGQHPKFDGMRALIKELKAKVEAQLRGDIPYVIVSTPQAGTVKPSKNGNDLTLQVTLAPTKEEKRDWFFEIGVAIYSATDTESYSLVEGRVRTKAFDKAKESFVGVKPQTMFSNHFKLDGFTDLNAVDKTKQYKLIMCFLSGVRPEGYQEIGGADTTSTAVPDKKPDATSASTSTAVTAATTASNTTNTPAQATTTATPTQTTNTPTQTTPVGDQWDSNEDDIDGAHSVKKFVDKVQKQLEDMWSRGKNPVVENVTMTITKNADGGFSTRTNATIGESTDGKAWVGFESRGSGGDGYSERADDQYKGGRYDEKGRPVLDKNGKQINKGQSPTKKDGTLNPCYGKSLAQCMKDHLGAGDVKLVAKIEDTNIPFKQYFINFTKPQKFPAK